MVTFDDVLPTVLRLCETYPGFGAVTKATVVRDLQGRVHLALQLPASDKFDVDALERALATELGSWFVGPVLGPQVAMELARLRGTVLGQNAPWRGSWADPIAGTTHDTLPGKWHRIERHLSKLAWTGTTPAKLPWPLVAHRPAIVTFFSFKGGVGRTTLLASTAMQLAADGKRVVAIDLDVEAPGLGSLLGATTRRGVVDFLVDHYATGTVDLDNLLAPASALDSGALRIDVVPAGNVDATYFEKLARLDFVGSGLIEPAVSSPVRDSLGQLITAISRRDPPPRLHPHRLPRRSTRCRWAEPARPGTCRCPRRT
jgi:hypothetical protein